MAASQTVFIQNQEQVNIEQLKAEKASLFATDYKKACKKVMFNAVKLKDPQDRIRVCEWLRKLKELKNDKYEESKMKNEYMQYLRVSLAGEYKVLKKPFSLPPPENLVPFAECIANLTCNAIPDLPRCGKIQPILCHKSDDNRAWMCVKRTPDNTILCYMAVAPDPLKIMN